MSIAMSFALSTLLNHRFAGALVMADDVRPGDAIKVGSLQGRVVRLRTRATELETPEGRRVFVPNVYLARNPCCESIEDVRRARRPHARSGAAIRRTTARAICPKIGFTFSPVFADVQRAKPPFRSALSRGSCSS